MLPFRGVQRKHHQPTFCWSNQPYEILFSCSEIQAEKNIPQVLPAKALKIWIPQCVVKTTTSKACLVPPWSYVIQCNLSRCDVFGEGCRMT